MDTTNNNNNNHHYREIKINVGDVWRQAAAAPGVKAAAEATKRTQVHIDDKEKHVVVIFCCHFNS